MHILYSKKTFAVKKLWRIWRITAFYQAFLPIFTISIVFPMQMDFSLPKFFPPNFLQSSFAKVFYCQSFLLYGIQQESDLYTIIPTVHSYS